MIKYSEMFVNMKTFFYLYETIKHLKVKILSNGKNQGVEIFLQLEAKNSNLDFMRNFFICLHFIKL